MRIIYSTRDNPQLHKGENDSMGDIIALEA
jgi:hypothetical protein